MSIAERSKEGVAGRARIPAELIGPSPIRPMERRLKRAIDLLLALPLLLVTSPIVAVLAVAIRLESPGSPIFRQQRLGEGGRLFDVFKLRTMVASPKPVDARHKAEDDPRVTRLGRLLRRSSVDELPQFWNVVRGDLSLVGPRPELPEFALRYYLPEAWRRLAVPPGMTGRWQVDARHAQPMYAHPEHDLRYVETWSLWQDLVLLARTPGAVFRGRGAC